MDCAPSPAHVSTADAIRAEPPAIHETAARLVHRPLSVRRSNQHNSGLDDNRVGLRPNRAPASPQDATEPGGLSL